MEKTCKQCKEQVEIWNEKCGGCGFHLVLEPDEELKARYLKTPSLGALLFTQGFTFGARLYVWFLLSLIPVVGIVALFACLFFGRRWSWKQGGWASWEEYVQRMKIMDGIGIAWIGILLASYFIAR